MVGGAQKKDQTIADLFLNLLPVKVTALCFFRLTDRGFEDKN